MEKNTMSADIIPITRPDRAKASGGSSGVTESQEEVGDLEGDYLTKTGACEGRSPRFLRHKLQEQIRDLVPPKVVERVERESAWVDMAYMIGATLSEIREQRGMGLTEVAHHSGISVPTITSIEVGGGVLGARVDNVIKYLNTLQAKIVLSLEGGGDVCLFSIGSGQSGTSAELLSVLRRMSGKTQTEIELANGWKGGFISRLEKQNPEKSVSATLGTISKFAAACYVNISLNSIILE
jgi:transcriptional regulator with XRE-family HTH domain